MECSVSEFARFVGLSEGAIRHAIRDRRIKNGARRNPDGKGWILESTIAADELRKNTDRFRGARSHMSGPMRPQTPARFSGRDQTMADLLRTAMYRVCHRMRSLEPRLVDALGAAEDSAAANLVSDHIEAALCAIGSDLDVLGDAICPGLRHSERGRALQLAWRWSEEDERRVLAELAEEWAQPPDEGPPAA
jgi:hypothetical protein